MALAGRSPKAPPAIFREKRHLNVTTLATSPLAAARRAMLDSQLRTSGVNADFVLARMGTLAREDFVPPAQRDLAYMDRAITLSDGGFLAAPLVQGMILQIAAPRGDERAIVVDGGSGYLAELLRPLVASVTVLAADDAAKASRAKEKADLLLVEGAAEELPAALLARLTPDARIVTGVLENGVTRIASGRRTASGVALLPEADIGMPRLAAFARPKGWSFP